MANMRGVGGQLEMNHESLDVKGGGGPDSCYTVRHDETTDEALKRLFRKKSETGKTD